jgi:hypothetical protein
MIQYSVGRDDHVRELSERVVATLNQAILPLSWSELSVIQAHFVEYEYGFRAYRSVMKGIKVSYKGGGATCKCQYNTTLQIHMICGVWGGFQCRVGRHATGRSCSS